MPFVDVRLSVSTGCVIVVAIAQLLGHSDVRVAMRYVRAVEDTKRVAVEGIKLTSKICCRLRL